MWWNENADTWILSPAQRTPSRCGGLGRRDPSSYVVCFVKADMVISVVQNNLNRSYGGGPIGAAAGDRYADRSALRLADPVSDRLCRRLKTPAPIPPAAGRRAPPVCRSARQRLRVQRNCGGTAKASRTPQELHARQTKRCRNRCRLMLGFQLSVGRSDRI